MSILPPSDTAYHHHCSPVRLLPPDNARTSSVRSAIHFAHHARSDHLTTAALGSLVAPTAATSVPMSCVDVAPTPSPTRLLDPSAVYYWVSLPPFPPHDGLASHVVVVRSTRL